MILIKYFYFRGKYKYKFRTVGLSQKRLKRGFGGFRGVFGGFEGIFGGIGGHRTIMKYFRLFDIILLLMEASDYKKLLKKKWKFWNPNP